MCCYEMLIIDGLFVIVDDVVVMMIVGYVVCMILDIVDGYLFFVEVVWLLLGY